MQTHLDPKMLSFFLEAFELMAQALRAAGLREGAERAQSFAEEARDEIAKLEPPQLELVE